MNFSDISDVKKAFEEVYTEIYKTRFWDLPITNHRLAVQVVGLKETNDFYTFCLITPWMLNKIAVAKKEDVNVDEIKGMRLDQLEQLGRFWVTNVISPMDGFTSMEEAVEEGEIQAERLFSEISHEDKQPPRDLSRRDFFRKMSPKN
ncbi:MAG: [NiFe]-hydrogenase assembly chaperone HybE [bacterium]